MSSQRSIGRFLSSVSVTGALLALATVLATGVPAAFAADDQPVIEYALVHHMINDAHQAPPLMRIYADGRVRVHYPVYMVRAGDYALQLTPDEVTDLLLSTAMTKLLELDLSEAHRLREQAAGGALHHVSDVTETVIRVRLTLPGGEAVKTVRWPNVYTDRRRFPDLVPVATISAAEERLRTLLERPDLARVLP